MSVRKLVTRFALAGLPALIAVIVVIAFASVGVGTKLGIDDAKRVNWVSSELVQNQVLTDDLVRGEPTAIAAVDEFVRLYVVQGSLVRVKVWSADGRVLYSNEARLIGQQFTLGEEELAVLEGRNLVEAEVSDLAKPENQFETESQLLEVYRGVVTPGGERVLFESYFRYDDVRSTGRELWKRFAPIAVGALVLLELVQIPFAIRLARRLRAGQQQRERLLQVAIEASDAERRRIAGDLHDGAVQHLTGVSMSLAAAARSQTVAPEAAAMMNDAGLKIRETVKSLRSMLVDIYPPNLHEEGLQSAFADLLGGLNNRGVVTDLHVDPTASRLSREHVSLLYRCAQEALRNVVAHAQAEHVAIRVEVTPPEAMLVVTDDGVGFDTERVAARAAEGHVGLRGLISLVEDSGGEMELRSEPGRGTQMTVRVAR